MISAINLCLQQLQQHEVLLQQHLVDQVQLYQIVQQQQSIYDTISSIAKPIRAHLLQQKLLHLPFLQKQKSRQHFLQEADKLHTEYFKVKQNKLNWHQEQIKILEHHNLGHTDLQTLRQQMKFCTQNNISFGKLLRTQLQSMPVTASQLQDFLLMNSMSTTTTQNPVAMKSPTPPSLGDTSVVVPTTTLPPEFEGEQQEEHRAEPEEENADELEQDPETQQ